MGAVTYKDQRVIDFVNTHLIPLQVPHNSQPLATIFKVSWTPTLVILDAEGVEHHRNVGFLPPEEFIPFLMLGQAKFHLNQQRYDAALLVLEQLLQDFPHSSLAPEAFFHRGVCRFRVSNDRQHLKEVYEFLKANYPQSEWFKRSYPYSLL